MDERCVAIHVKNVAKRERTLAVVHYRDLAFSFSLATASARASEQTRTNVV